MSAGYNFIANVVGENNVAITSGALVAVGLSVLAVIGSRKVAGNISGAVVPDQKLTVANFWDIVVSFILSLSDNVMGKENRKHIPFVGAIFIFLFGSNLLGLIPGFSAPTTSVTFNLGISLIVFVLYHIYGVKEMGLVHYFAHFGMIELPSIKKIFIFIPALGLWGVLFCIEMISHVIRPLVLSVRIFANMTADHALLGAFLDLMGQIGLASFFYFMGTFISLLQAFVFTVLTMVYIRLASGHGDGEH